MTGELRHGRDRNWTCPGCGGRKTDTAALCRSCRTATGKTGRTADPTWGRLRRGDEGYGPTCPVCGGRKWPQGRRCAECAGVARTRERAHSPDTVYEISRRESTVTFRHDPTGALQTRVCVGRGRKAQIADGLAQLSGDDWVVETISTPQSILTDLKQTAP